MPRTDADLLAAFWRYEQALIANDVAVLDELFADGSETLRSQAGLTLHGHQAISDFRGTRTPPAARVLQRLHVRPLGADAAVLVAESRGAEGRIGAQTQVWERRDGDWRITAAHVSTGVAVPADPAPFDEADAVATWRVGPCDPPLAAGEAGALSGARVAVKDLFAVAGQQVGAGNPRYLQSAPVESEHAAAVSLLLAAGASITGLVQTDELAFSLAGQNLHYGTPPNPAAPGRIPGGSSSGCVAAVASGQADLGLGTDTAGSIRVPASYTGLYGLRTTHGAVPVDGLVGLAPSFDAVGVLAADPSVLRQAATALLPQQPAVPITTLLVSETLDALAEPATRSALTAARTALALRHGLTMRAVDLHPDDLADWFAAFRTVQQAEAWRLHGGFVEDHGDSLAPEIRGRFLLGRDTTSEQEVSARATLSLARAQLHDLLPDGVALALPSSSGPALAVDALVDDVTLTRVATLRLTCLASLAGLPALSLPLASADGAPVGLCVAAAPGADLGLARLTQDHS